MTTLAERIATLEEWRRESRERIEAIEDSYNGGGDVDYTRSVRGRLHTIEATLAGFVLRRNFAGGMLKSWERSVLVLCAVGTVAAAWYGALGH